MVIASSFKHASSFCKGSQMQCLICIFRESLCPTAKQKHSCWENILPILSISVIGRTRTISCQQTGSTFSRLGFNFLEIHSHVAMTLTSAITFFLYKHIRLSSVTTFAPIQVSHIQCIKPVKFIVGAVGGGGGGCCADRQVSHMSHQPQTLQKNSTNVAPAINVPQFFYKCRANQNCTIFFTNVTLMTIIAPIFLWMFHRWQTYIFFV